MSDYTANYLVIRCVELEVEEKHEEMKTCARQTILMQVSAVVALRYSLPFVVRMVADMHIWQCAALAVH